MIVRELLTRLGFKVDDAGAKKYEKTYEQATRRVGAAMGRVQAAFGGIGVQLAAAFGINAVFNLARDADELAASLDAVSRGTGQQVKSLAELVPIANEARTSVAALTESYISLMRAGLKEKDALDVSRLIGMTGASQSAIYQLMQALSSGMLQGDELRSILEGGGNLDNAIANGLGVSVGALRNMAKEGKLTTEVIVGALRKSEQYIKDNRSSVFTLSQAMTNLKNSMLGVVAGSEEASTGIRLLTKAVLWLSDHTGVLAGLFTVFLGGSALIFLAWVAEATKSLLLFGRAVALFLYANPVVLAIAAIVAGLVLLGLAVQDVYKWITGGKSIIGDWLGPWTDVVAKVKALWTDFVAFLSTGWDTFRTATAAAIDGALSGIYAAIQSAITDPWGTLWSMTLPGMLEAAVPGLFDPLRDAFDGALATIRGLWDSFWNGVMSKTAFVRNSFAGRALGIDDASLAEPTVDGTRASGGPVNRGGQYLVGEQGPEMFVPRKSGLILPSWLTSMMGVSGGMGLGRQASPQMPIEINLGGITVQAAEGMSTSTARDQGKVIVDEVERLIDSRFRRIIDSTLASFPETI